MKSKPPSEPSTGTKLSVDYLYALNEYNEISNKFANISSQLYDYKKKETSPSIEEVKGYIAIFKKIDTFKDKHQNLINTHKNWKQSIQEFYLYISDVYKHCNEHISDHDCLTFIKQYLTFDQETIRCTVNQILPKQIHNLVKYDNTQGTAFLKDVNTCNLIFEKLSKYITENPTKGSSGELEAVFNEKLVNFLYAVHNSYFISHIPIAKALFKPIYDKFQTHLTPEQTIEMFSVMVKLSVITSEGKRVVYRENPEPFLDMTKKLMESYEKIAQSLKKEHEIPYQVKDVLGYLYYVNEKFENAAKYFRDIKPSDVLFSHEYAFVLAIHDTEGLKRIIDYTQQKNADENQQRIFREVLKYLKNPKVVAEKLTEDGAFETKEESEDATLYDNIESTEEVLHELLQACEILKKNQGIEKNFFDYLNRHFSNQKLYKAQEGTKDKLTESDILQEQIKSKTFATFKEKDNSEVTVLVSVDMLNILKKAGNNLIRKYKEAASALCKKPEGDDGVKYHANGLIAIKIGGDKELFSTKYCMNNGHKIILFDDYRPHKQVNYAKTATELDITKILGCAGEVDLYIE